jgi:hypothetical protein
MCNKLEKIVHLVGFSIGKKTSKVSAVVVGESGTGAVFDWSRIIA